MRRGDGPDLDVDRSGATPLHAQQNWNLAGRAKSSWESTRARGSARCGRCCRYTVPSKTIWHNISFAQPRNEPTGSARAPPPGRKASVLFTSIMPDESACLPSGLRPLVLAPQHRRYRGTLCLPGRQASPSIDLRDRLAERGPVHDEDRERRPQKRREHAEDGVGAEVRRHEARHDREDDARQ